MGDKEDYLTSYRVFFENFAATVNPEDQLPVQIAGYTITEAELPGEVIYWTTQYLSEKQCPLTLMTPLRRIILDEVRIASKKHPTEFGYKPEESVYIALRLMQAVTARVNDVCLRYLDNSRLDSLPPPPPLEQRELQTVSIATKNSRRVMEDRHVEIGNLEALFGIETTEPTSFYAVYDGHAGSAAAMYCAAHLHQYLVDSPHFSKDLNSALRDAFLRTDAEFVRKSNQERACGGSTAVCVCVRGKKLVAAWAGDSLALLAKRMRLMQLVHPHKPGRQDERERIEQSGGTVMFWGTWRVNGQLAVSRAIGDAQYKPYVTARPETATVEMDGDEDFVVVACDGLWDFVSEDDVALSVYRQIAADPDDLKAVTKRLVVQAKRQGSADNISIIVVFLKDPRDIAADNCPPMDLGLDNALANAPPFVMETEACKRLDGAAVEAEAECEAEAEADNGVDNSDSDSEDLGPETAVDADDLDNDTRHHEPQPPTPPAHAVEENHVDSGLIDNVAESGEESEDEWNYFKGEGEREPRGELDDREPASDTPCQDNSAWETSSVDMNSSPLNPDAPVFVPGTVGSDVLLAESPRKPVPMDDIELPDSAQFQTEAVVRPAELLDLDNCDQLNGHHNISTDNESKEQLNGNDKCNNLDSLGFGFSVGIEPNKVNDNNLIQDFERIQKDTTDFCDIQVFQANSETNPFASAGNDELFERLKNKESDPMSMSFYKEKDDDTCERLGDRVDLNAVQPLPDSDEDEDKENLEDKENVSPHETGDPHLEPNNDIIRFDERTEPTDLLNDVSNFGQDNFVAFNNTVNIQGFSTLEFESNVNEEVAHTDTPESHKLLFEQIPEIPDGKSSELGFSNEDVESEKDSRVITPHEETSQDVDMESKPDDSPYEEMEPKLSPEPVVENLIETEHSTEVESQIENHSTEEANRGLMDEVNDLVSVESNRDVTPEPAHDLQHNIVVDVHSADEARTDDVTRTDDVIVREIDTPEVHAVSPPPALSPAPSPLPAQSPLPSEPVAPSPQPALSPLPSQSPLPSEPVAFSAPSPLPAHSPLPSESVAFSAHSPLPSEPVASPMPAEVPLPPASPLPAELAARLSPSPPDIVPDQRELITDIDIGIPESRAQEICVPVTSEIPPADGTPPPTPAALNDTPMAADLTAAAVAAAAVTATAVAATKKTTPVAKKPSTLKVDSKAPAKASPKPSTTTPRPLSAKKTAPTPTSATKSPAVAKSKPAALPATKPVTKTTVAPKAAAPKSAPAPKPAPARVPTTKPAVKEPAATKTAAPTRVAPISRPAAPAKEPAITKTAVTNRTAPVSRPAPRPATAPARPPATKPAPARPAPRPATATTRPKPLDSNKPADKKPLLNGDAKPPAARPAPAAPRPRPAPRPTPRANTAPTSAAAKATTAAVPKPLPRSTRPPGKDADKQSKDLANKRITAKTAPPRTATNKAPVPPKGTTMKAVPRKAAEVKKEVATNGPPNNGLSNGTALPDELAKPPPSPPQTDNALLPDVIA